MKEIITQQIKQVQCPECKNGYMQYIGVQDGRTPKTPEYLHRCPQCWSEKILPRIYPVYEDVYIENGDIESDFVKEKNYHNHNHNHHHRRRRSLVTINVPSSSGTINNNDQQ